MVTKIGICKEAFSIKGHGMVLDFWLYSESNDLHNKSVRAKIICNGIETHEVNCILNIILCGKKHRYDMNPYNITIKDTISKEDVIGSTIYLLEDYSFWQPANVNT